MSTDKEGDPDGSKKPETIASDTENSQKNAPPLVATKTGDPPLEDDISNHHKSVHSDVTGATKHSSPFTPQQAGYCEPSFESLLCKILQRILDFRSKDPVPIVPSTLEDNGTRSVVDFIGLSEENADSLGFQDNRGFKRLGSSHKQSILILQVLINDYIDREGETQSDILVLLAQKCTKGYRVRLIKEQR